MEKQYCVKLELHGKRHVSYVKAASEIDAIMQARTLVKDWCNVASIISIQIA